VAGLGLGLVMVLAAGGLVVEARAQVPGPEIFAKEPTTPLELWDAADYLVRTGQATAAAPYLRKFAAANPDDETLLQIRDRYGARSFLRLQDSPATRALAEPLVARLVEASHRHATRPDRISRAIAALTKSQEEQDYAVDRLREAGPYAVPPVVAELQKPALSADDRARIVRNLGRLDTTVVPPLIATLDAPDPGLAAVAADVLGRIGDARAVPALTALAAAGTDASDAARRAVGQLSGLPFDAQPKPPVRLLADEARKFHTHQVQFPGDPVVLWAWDDQAKAPVPRTVPKSEAEAHFGLKYARAALKNDQADLAARVVLTSLTLEKAVERAGFDKYPAVDPSNAFADAVAAGPAVLGEVLRGAIADGKTDLAAVAATALGRVTDASSLASEGTVNPLVEALSAPGRRTRFAAAKALVGLDPPRPFAGSSRVVPVLAQFLVSGPAPRAVVIDSNLARGGLIAGQLRELGLDPIVALTGEEGFRAASERADVELVLLDIHLTRGGWRLHDTLANLRSDARTAGLPVYAYGPLHFQPDLASLDERFPGVKLLVTPTTAQVLNEQLGVAGRPRPLSAAERAGYAREAAAMLARIASRPDSPFGPDLTAVEPALAAALNAPETAEAALVALGSVPLPDAQRGLADALIDPSKPAALRLTAAAQLARSARRFGALVAADQEVKLWEAFDRAGDPALKDALGAVVAALRPRAATAAAGLSPIAPAPAAAPGAGAPAPSAASPSPEAQPSPAETPNPNPPGTEAKP
jgi:hypothetical protein